MKQREAMRMLDKARIPCQKSGNNHIVYTLPDGYRLSLNGGKKECTPEMVKRIRKAV